MADYWVSQNKKYCEFCRCWITDNRPSVDFHEKGRRHQENVKKKLRNITRQSTKVQKASDKLDATLRQMESAALESYRKDMVYNADLTSMAIKSKIQSDLASGASASCSIKKLWNEKKTRDGKSYYVNIMTKETVWKPPPEGYSSIQEQHDIAFEEARKQLETVEKVKKKEGLIKLQEIKQNEAEERARLFREKMKERRVTDESPPETCGPLLEPGKTQPYGKWQTVREMPVIDYGLPVQNYQQEYEPQVEYEPEPYVREFKEKTVETLPNEEDDTGTVFKKRKLGGGAKRNARQRLDDD